MRSGLRPGGRGAILNAQFPRLILWIPLLGQGMRDALFSTDGLVVRGRRKRESLLHSNRRMESRYLL